MKHSILSLIGLAGLLAAAGACSDPAVSDDDDGGGGGSATGCNSNAECIGDAAGPVCDPDAKVCGPAPQGGIIGWGDGSVTSVGLAYVYAPDTPMEVTDMEFHPDRPNELWVLRRPFESSEPCSQNNMTAAGCLSLEGTVAVVENVGTEDVAVQNYKDPNAWHFMRRPSAMAFANNATFATTAEARTGNFQDDPFDYMGPTLWSSNRSMFAVQPPGLNGSHLDMLHAAPYAMGIAHEVNNLFWVFNGDAGSIDRTDFHADHGPGEDDHSDGEVARYVEGQLTRLPGVPSHMHFDASDGSVYIADSGGGRVARLDPSTATVSVESITPNYDMLANVRTMQGGTLTDIVPPGTLAAPSGLAVHEGVLYVTDNASGRIHAFTMTGEPLRTLDTGLPPGSLTAFQIGPDGKGYYADKPTGSIYRIDPF